MVTDPYPPSLGPRLGRLEADLVTVSHEHENHSYLRAVAKDPFVIAGPGEYEVAGVVVHGLPTFHDASQGSQHGRNTVYLIELDEVRVCHLGDLGHTLDDQALDKLGNVDLLLVPVGGGATLDAARAAEVVRQLEPRVVVPMHYALPSLTKELAGVDRFLREMGVPETQPLARLAVHPGSGEAETKVVVLEARV